LVVECALNDFQLNTLLHWLLWPIFGKYNGFLFFKQARETNLSFSVVTKLIQRFEHSHQALGFQREWNRIAIVLISVCTVNKCNPFSTYCISGVVLPRSVVCSWGGQDQYSWCVLPKGVCFLKGSRSHYFGGLCVVICFDYLVDYLVVLWGLDVALGLRVNQYNLLVYLFLTLNSFKFCFKLYWYKQPIVSKKQPIVFLLLCCFIAYILG